MGNVLGCSCTLGESREDLEPIIKGEKGKTACIVVDVQRDFMEGGSLQVPEADYDRYLPSVQSFITQLRSAGVHIVISRDFHPAGHKSFASAHGKPPFSMTTLSRDDKVVDQTLWPDHCVQNTPGVEMLVPPVANYDYVASKGEDMGAESYSAFYDCFGKELPLKQHLKEQKIENVLVLGLATDFCVFSTARDAVKAGFGNVLVVKDLCRGIDANFDWKNYVDAGVKLSSSITANMSTSK